MSENILGLTRKRWFEYCKKTDKDPLIALRQSYTSVGMPSSII